MRGSKRSAVATVLLLLPTLLAAGCSGLHRSDTETVLVANALLTGGAVTKTVVSMRGARFRNLVRQRTDFSCGAAAVATILKYAYGLEDTNEVQVLNEMLQFADAEVVAEKGFSLLDIKNFVEGVGMQAIGFRIQPENLDRIKIPAIVLLDIKGYKHFAVFKTTRNDEVYLADPALGNKVMTREEFARAWNGVVLAIVADFYNKETVLLEPSGPASAKALLTRRTPVPDASLLDFGMEHRDLLQF